MSKSAIPGIIARIDENLATIVEEIADYQQQKEMQRIAYEEAIKDMDKWIKDDQKRYADLDTAKRVLTELAED